MMEINSKITRIWYTSIFVYVLSQIILIVIGGVNFMYAQGASISLFFIIILFSRVQAFSFLIADNCIEIHNELRPFYKKYFHFDKLKDIEVKGVAYRGLTLVLSFKDQSKKYFAVTGIEIEELQMIVEEFKKYKEKM